MIVPRPLRQQPPVEAILNNVQGVHHRQQPKKRGRDQQHMGRSEGDCVVKEEWGAHHDQDKENKDVGGDMMLRLWENCGRSSRCCRGPQCMRSKAPVELYPYDEKEAPSMINKVGTTTNNPELTTDRKSVVSSG